MKRFLSALLLAISLALPVHADCVLRQSDAAELTLGPYVDSTDGVSAETGLTISQGDVILKKCTAAGDCAAAAQKNDSSACAHDANGMYECDLDATDTNTVGMLEVWSFESGAAPVFRTCLVLEEAVYDQRFAASATGAVPVSTGGIAAAAFAAGAIDATAIAADAIGASEVAADAIGAAEIANAAIDSATYAAGAIDAAAIAADAIGASEVAADAIGASEIATDAIGAAELAANAIAAAEIAADALTAAKFDSTAGPFAPLRIVDQGTAQSATGTTLVLRAAAAFADDELIGSVIVVTGGSAGVGQSKVITDYVSSTDTATVATWTTTPTGTITYKLFAEPAGSAGAVSISAGGITASSFAAGAIDATAIATDAIGTLELAANAIGAAEVADGTIDEATYATTAGSFDVFGIVDQGTAQAVSGTSLQLRSAATFADDEIVGATCVITGGSTGVGQSRAITDYVSSTDTATVATWTTTPTGTITYLCFGTAAGNATSVSIAAGGITSASFTAGAIDDAAIATDAIGANEIAASAIGASEIATDAIGAAEVAADAIGASEIAANALTTAEIATGAISSDEVADGAIDAGAFAADAITAAKLAADVTTELQSGLATAAALAVVSGFIDTEIAALLIGVNVSKINNAVITGDGSGTPFDVTP